MNPSAQKVISRTLTVMFLDLANYTKTTASLTREKFSILHDIFDGLTLPHFGSYAGTVIKKIGDAYLVTFDSPTNAVLCSVEIQRSFSEYRGKHPKDTPLNVRIAIHMGEVILRDNDVYGDTVNATARIEGVAEADQIVVSQAVYEAINHNEITLVPLGAFKLKGLRRPLRLYRIQTKQDLILERRKKRARKQQRLQRQLLKITVLIILWTIAAAIFYYYFM